MDCNSHSFGSRQRLKCNGACAENRFHLSAKRTCPFKLVGVSVQSTTGSRGVRISGSNAGYTMFRGSVNSNGYPLHSPVSPSLPLLCITVCHHVSTGLYVSPTQPPSCLHYYRQHEFPGGNWPISDFKLPKRSRRKLHSPGILCSEWRQFLAVISWQTISPIFNGQDDRLPQNVGKKLPLFSAQ
jgi:hypothetical protein